jgi:hypothetical protein
MSRVAINTGSVANDGTGDSLRIAGGKINDNFSELYNFLGDGTDLTPTWDKTAAGVNTTSNVGIGTTNPRFALEVGAVGASGTSLYVNGNARVTGILTVGSSSIILNGNANRILVGSGISLDGNTGIISATAFYAGGSLISGGGGGGGDSYWGSGASGISTTANVAIGTVTPTSKLTVVGNSLFSGIATFRNNLTLSNLISSSNTLRFGSNSYIDQSANDVLTFQINTGINTNSEGSSFVFRTTEPNISPIPDFQLDALRIYSRGDYWNGLVRVYTDLHVDDNAFVGGDLQVGAASTLIGAGSTLGSFRVGAGGTVITTTSGGLVGIGTSVPNSNLHVVGVSTFNGDVHIDDRLYVSGVQITGAGGTGGSVASIGEDITTRNLSVSGISTFNGVIITPGLISDGVSTGDIYSLALEVAGVSTFSGAIDANSTANFQGDVTLQSNLILGDNDEIQLGTSGGDLLITHLSSTNNSLIRNKNASGSFIIDTATGSPIEIRHSSGGEPMGIFTPNGSVSLYYDNSKKFETLGAGVTITGTTFTNQLSVSGVSTLTSNVSVGGTISVDGGVKLATNNATIVGTSGTVGEIKRIGGAPFFYDGSAWREFVLSSGTPVSVPADTDWDNVILRNTFDTSFDDAKFSVSPIAVGSGSTIVSSPLKVGTKSFRNDGTAGAGISFAYRSEYDFTGPWTIEFWIYHDAAALNGQYLSLVSMTNSSNTSGEWSFGLYSNGFSQYWYWDNENNGSARGLEVVANSTFNSNYLNQWVHYALVREADNGSIHFYINGVESSATTSDGVIDNNILDISGSGLQIGGVSSPTINGVVWNSGVSIDAFIDDLRISTIARYTSIGISTYATFTPSTTALPTTGTLSSYVQPPGDKYGEITLGGSPTWRGTSGVTVSQQSSGNYRVSFASTYTNRNDYYVLSQGMDQGFASYVGIARSTTHVDFSINRQSNDAAVDTGSLSVQIKNHI